MIKVLIIDNEPDGVISAHAGLIPYHENEQSNIDVEQRYELAKATFDIVVCNDVKSAVKQVKEFKPDLVIIDVNLETIQPIVVDDFKLINGIDIYRFLEHYSKDIVKLMFTNHAKDYNYVKQLLNDEEEINFISKADRVSYEILASKISKYLRRVAVNIVSEIDEEKKKLILEDLKEQDWDFFCKYSVKTESRRKINLLDLCAFNSYITLERQSAKLMYKNPIEELTSLFVLQNISNNKKEVKKDWNRKSIKGILNYVKDNDKYHTQINDLTEKIILAQINGIDKEPNFRLVNQIPFRITSFMDDTFTYSNDRFLKQFLNALTIRRVLIFFEIFISENIDNKIINVKGKWKDFFNHVPNQVLRSTQIRYKEYFKSDTGQLERSLNLTFKFPNECREIVLLKGSIYPFDTDWFNSDKCVQLKEKLKKACVQ